MSTRKNSIVEEINSNVSLVNFLGRVCKRLDDNGHSSAADFLRSGYYGLEPNALYSEKSGLVLRDKPVAPKPPLDETSESTFSNQRSSGRSSPVGFSRAKDDYFRGTDDGGGV